MNASAVQITYQTLRKHLGKALVEKEAELCYVTGLEHGLHMKNDWAVSYWKGIYQGKPCLFFRWSHIEHIFLEA